MIKTKVDMNPERLLITNLIVSEPFCRSIMPLFKTSLLKTEYARIVAGWIEDYWLLYKTCPGKDIQNIYQHKKADLRDSEEAENIAEFLGRLSRESIENEANEEKPVNNVEYAVASATTYLKIRSLEILRENIDGALQDNNVLQGEQLVANYTRIAIPSGEGIDILKNPAKVAAAFMEEEELLFQFPGAMGRIAGKFNRGDFLAFLAPMKRGKTWHLWNVVECALYAGLKIVLFTMEMTENQMTRRAWQSLVGSPREDHTISIPYFEEVGEGRYVIRQRKEDRERVDTSKIADFQKVLRKRFRTGGVKIISFPAYSATMDDIDAAIDNLHFYEGFTADVIVIDYLDIVAPSKGFKGEYRHQIDDIWKRGRRMAQERHALVATVSQSDRTTFNEDVTEANVSEDIRKMAHVTSMVGLNQTKEEKEKGIMRLGQLALREGTAVFDQAVVLYNFEIGRAALDSRFAKEVDFEKPVKNKDEEEYEKEHEKPRRRPHRD